MSLVLQQKSGYEPLPEGTHPVTITEVKDLGEQDTAYGKKRQLYIQFTTPSGKGMRAYYTASINEKANLYKAIKSITGQPPSAKFDVETLVGRNLQILVEHYTNKKGANAGRIVAFLKPAPGQTAAKAQPRPAYAGVAEDGTGITDADISF